MVGTAEVGVLVQGEIPRRDRCGEQGSDENGELHNGKWDWGISSKLLS